MRGEPGMSSWPIPILTLLLLRISPSDRATLVSCYVLTGKQMGMYIDVHMCPSDSPHAAVERASSLELRARRQRAVG